MESIGRTASLILIAILVTANCAYAAPADETSVPDLKGSIDKSVNVKSGTGNYSIIWDAWRNNVMKAVWAKFCILLEGGDAIKVGPLFLKMGMAPKPKFPPGTGATFHFTVAADRKIKDVKIVEPSGDAEFDALIKKSVEALEGKRILDFPEGSNRTDVYMGGRLITKRNGKFNSMDYNDVEKIKGTDDTVEPHDQ